MSPLPPIVGVAELALRWDVSRAAVSQFLAGCEDFPEGQRTGNTPVWARADVDAWEAAAREAGRRLPGDQKRGPAPGTGGRPPKKRFAPDA